MSRNTMLSIVALLLVALVGGAGAFWAYKKYKQKQNREFRYEGTMGTAKENFDASQFKANILDDATMDATVEKHQLVSVWGVADSAAAKARLQEKFLIKVSDGVVKVSFQDKDKELAKSVLETVVNLYYKKVNAGRLSVPPSR